jgi:hypothetical protein
MSDPARILGEARRELARLPLVLDALLGDLDEATWRGRPAPERWSPVEIICHLRDEETEDFGARIRVALAGGGPFAPIRPAEWVVERHYQDEDPVKALAAFRSRRGESLALLDSLVSSPGDLQGSGEAGGGALRLSGLDVLAAWVAHDQLHLRQLAGTLACLWAAAHEPLKVEYAGALPYRSSPRE